MRLRWMLSLLPLFAAAPSAAQAPRVTIDGFTGTAFNLPVRLSIRQSGERDLGFTAHYDTKPLEDTPYFGARVSVWKGDRAFVVTLVHHKLYLSNPPPEVAWFRITYGFNMGTIGVGWRRGNLSYNVGAGGVVTHASSMVRGKRYLGTGGPLNRGYTFSGVTALGGVQYKLPLSRSVYLSAETMVSASYIEVGVKEGQAQVPEAAFHLHAGIGYQW